MHSLSREGRYEPLALKCPWLGKIRSCSSLGGCKMVKLFGLLKLCHLSFPILPAQGFSSYYPASMSDKVFLLSRTFIWAFKNISHGYVFQRVLNIWNIIRILSLIPLLILPTVPFLGLFLMNNFLLIMVCLILLFCMLGNFWLDTRHCKCCLIEC